MSLVQAKCENCGGLLKVESSLKAANCPNCGTAYVVQDAINYYNSITNIENLHADVLVLNDDSSADARIKAADAHLKAHNYKEAEREYRKATELTPQNYRGWWGLVQCGMENRKVNYDTPSISSLKKYIEYVEKFAPADIKEGLMKEWKSYVQSESNKKEIKIKLKPRRNELYKTKAIKRQELKEVNRSIERIHRMMNGENEDPITIDKKKSIGFFVSTIICFILAIVIQDAGVFSYVLGAIGFVCLFLLIKQLEPMFNKAENASKYSKDNLNREIQHLNEEKQRLESEINDLDSKIDEIDAEIKEKSVQ